jgi:hypothetical protein
MIETSIVKGRSGRRRSVRQPTHVGWLERLSDCHGPGTKPLCKLLFAVAGLGLGVALIAGCGQKDDVVPLTDYDRLREAVVERVMRGELNSQPSGVAMLPEELKDASANGRIYVSSNEVAGVAVVFVVSQLPGNHMEGLLYVESPPDQAPSRVRLGPVTWTVARELRRHWYHVSSMVY